MKKDIEIAYNSLKLQFDKPTNEIGEHLVDFSIEYSRNDEVHFKSLILKEDINKYFEDTKLREEILKKMESFAEEIFSTVRREDDFVSEKFELSAIQAQWAEKRKPRDVVFSCKGISKNYPNSNFELKDITLQLKSGEITGVVGENGNGKTTLLKIIAGELYPKRGSGEFSYGVLQENKTVLDWGKIKPHIAYLPQELGRLVGSVKKSIQYAAAVHGMIGQQNNKEVNYIIQRLGLGKYENATWEELSGGYKLRFALAMTLVWKPKLMVLDEPLANLDINTQIRVLNDLRDLCKSIKYPIAIILSSQNIEEVEAASDNMIVLKEGEITCNKETSQIGDDRQGNVFEFRCNFIYKELQYCLNELEYKALDYNGFSYFITTPLNVSELHFLKYCADKNISLTYFQDISISTKKLIIKTTLD